MFCPTGLDLYERYQQAESEKNAFAARKLATEVATQTDRPAVSSREVYQAKQRYVEHFANWLSHKAFCQDCKPKAPSKGEQRSIEPGR